MPQKFPSEIGPSIIIMTSLPLTLVSAAMIHGRIWPGLIITILVAAFVTYMLKTTYYLIDEKLLIIHCGFFKPDQIDIAEIKSIRPSNNPISSPAASLDRLEIKYGKNQFILISPRDKVSFIKEIIRINPDCIIKPK
jgi:hypothetical protein